MNKKMIAISIIFIGLLSFVSLRHVKADLLDKIDDPYSLASSPFRLLNSTSKWKVIKGLGNNYSVKFSDVHSLDTYAYFCLNNAKSIEDLPKNIPSVESEDTTLIKTIVAKEYDGSYCFEVRTESDDFIRFNPTIVYQNESYINFNDERVDVNCTLRKWNGEEYVIAPEDIWINDVAGYKFGANDTVATNDTFYQYEWLSNKEIKYSGRYYYFDEYESGETGVAKVYTRSILDLSDICDNNYWNYSGEGENMTCIGYKKPNCVYSLHNYYKNVTDEENFTYETLDYSKLLINFTGFYDASAGMVFIDPEYEYINVSTDATLTTNIRTEFDYSHVMLNDSSLVLYMNFDEGNGSTYYDLSGNDNDGTSAGNVYSNLTGCIDGYDECAKFDGSGDYIDVGDLNYTSKAYWQNNGTWRHVAMNGTHTFVDGLLKCPEGMAYIDKLGGYCIDKYEATPLNSDGSYNDSQFDYNSSTFATNLLNDGGMAGSEFNRTPWVYVSLVQARTACENAGKHLCTDAEWLGAANIHGQLYDLPVDLGDTWHHCVTDSSEWCTDNSPGSGEACNTGTYSGGASNCASAEGVYDMTGNVWEWTNETTNTTKPDSCNPAGSGWCYINSTKGFQTATGSETLMYGNDGVYFLGNSNSGRAVRRGGGWSNGADAGPFCAALLNVPADTHSGIGFRCCQGTDESETDNNWTTPDDVFSNFTNIFNSEGVYYNVSNLLIGNYYAGSVDEVMIFNRFLSAHEIGLLYNSSFPRFYPQGNQTFEIQNITLGSHNKVNVTVKADANNGSSLSARIYEADISSGAGYVNTDESLVLYMHLDNESAYGESNSLVYDFSGNENNGTANGDASPTADGKFDGGFEFDGSGDYLQLSYSQELDFGNKTNITVMGWFLLNSSSDASQEIVSNFNDEGGTDRAVVFIDNYGSTHGVCTFNFPGTNCDMDGLFTLNQWYHVAVTYDGADKVYYRNGNKGVIYSAVGTITLGNDGGTGVQIGEFFNGTIDEVMIFNRSLSADEIKELYYTQSINYKNDGVGINWTESSSGTVTFTTHNASHKNASFDVTNTSTHLLTEIEYDSGDYQFYSPLLYDVSIESYYYVVSGEDVTAPVISNLINTSTDNESSYITWSTDENANYTLILYNNTNRTSESIVHTVYNNTFLSSFTQNVSGLLNATTYLINLTACDSSGNCAQNNTVNFTTEQNTLVTDDCTTITNNNGNIDDGNEYTIDTICDITPNTLRINSGKLKIISTGYFRAVGCYKADEQSLYIEDGGGLYCET